MLSAHGPQQREERDQDVADDDFDHRQVAILLGAHGIALQRVLDDLVEVLRAGQTPTHESVTDVRVELEELQVVLERYVASACPRTTPWETAGEHLPNERLQELTTES